MSTSKRKAAQAGKGGGKRAARKNAGDGGEWAKPYLIATGGLSILFAGCWRVYLAWLTVPPPDCVRGLVSVHGVGLRSHTRVWPT
jgi:hypothetical protein